MTIDDLKARPDFVVGLADQQKDFVLAFCSNGGDKLAAAKTAYNCGTEQSAVTIANRLVEHPIVKRLITDYFNIADELGSKSELQALLWKRLNGNLDEKYWLSTADLYAEVAGFKQKPADALPPKESDTDWVSRLEKVKA